MLQPKVWIVIADGAHARVLTPAAVEGRFRELTESDAPEYIHTSGIRHAIRVDDKAHFAHEIAHRLDAAIRVKAYEQLVLIAPGKILHEIRAALGHEAAAAVTGTESKDLIKLGVLDLDHHLARWWLAPVEPEYPGA